MKLNDLVCVWSKLFNMSWLMDFVKEMFKPGLQFKIAKICPQMC